MYVLLKSYVSFTQGSRRGCQNPGTGVKDRCERIHMGAGNWIQVPMGTANAHLLSHILALPIPYAKTLCLLGKVLSGLQNSLEGTCHTCFMFVLQDVGTTKSLSLNLTTHLK